MCKTWCVQFLYHNRIEDDRCAKCALNKKYIVPIYYIDTPNLITESVIVLCCVHGEMYLKNTKMQRHFIHGNITTPSQILWWKQHLVTDSVKFHRICDGIVLFPCMKFNKILLSTYHYNITESVKYHRFCDCLDLFSCMIYR